METKLQRYARGVFQTKTAREGAHADVVIKFVSKMSLEQAQAVVEYSQNHALAGTAEDIAELAAAKVWQELTAMAKPAFDRRASARNQWSDPEMRAKMVGLFLALWEGHD